MDKVQFRKYLIEGSLIVFSVMLALFLNKVVENIDRNFQKKEAIERISAEIERNHEITRNWLIKHTNIRNRTTEIVSGAQDSLKEQLLEKSYFDFSVLTAGQSFVNANLSNTAWETSKSTDILTEFDFETVEILTGVYALQDIIFTKTITDISSIFFERETHRSENLDETLIQFQLRFTELIGQERLLIESYKQALEVLGHQ